MRYQTNKGSELVDQDSGYFTTMLVTQLYWKADILLTCRKHLHDRIISLREVALYHK